MIDTSIDSNRAQSKRRYPDRAPAIARCLAGLLFLLLAGYSFATAQAEDSNLASDIRLLGTLAPLGTDTYYTDIWGYAADGREYACLGHREGSFIIDVTDPANPRELAFIEGARSNWRDLKVHGHYLYVVHDGNENSYAEPGMQIIDLSDLPNSASLAATFNENMGGQGLAHNLYIDNGLAYIAGARENSGLIILNLADPLNPSTLTTMKEPYWHDVVVNKGIIFGSAIGKGQIHIVDGSDPENLQDISRTTYPGAFTHNMWMTDDNAYLITTDEVNGRPVNFWDISNLEEPEWLASYGPAYPAVAHNAHIKDDLAYISYYYDGLKIIDIGNRRAPVEIAHYDTYPDDNFERGTGFHGCWGVYTDLPSGNLLVSDITYGLFVLRFEGRRASYVEGKVFDAGSQQPIGGVEVSLANPAIFEGSSKVESASDGSYLIGARAGAPQLNFFKYGWEPLLVDDIAVASAERSRRDVFLTKIPTAPVLLTFRTTLGEAVAGSKLFIRSDVYDFVSVQETDAKGEIRVNLLFDDYSISLREWGFLPFDAKFRINEEGLNRLEFELEPGYYENFTAAPEWSRYDSQDSTGLWKLVRSKDQEFENFLPSFDPFAKENGFYSWSRTQLGRAVLTSPSFDATRLIHPVVEYYRLFNPARYTLDPQADDSLLVQLSNDDGASWTSIETVSTIDTAWKRRRHHLELFQTLSSTMRMRFIHIEGDREERRSVRIRRPSYCAIDELTIVSGDLTTFVESEQSAGPVVDLHYWPNPAYSIVQLEWQPPTSIEATLSIFDPLGMLVKRIEIAPQSGGKVTIDLNVSDFSAGLYYLRLSSGNFTSPAKSLIIVR